MSRQRQGNRQGTTPGKGQIWGTWRPSEKLSGSFSGQVPRALLLAAYFALFERGARFDLGAFLCFFSVLLFLPLVSAH